MCKVSVIVPAYNGEKYLDQALGSVFAQKYDDFELILVDDGSVDNTKSLADKYILKYKDKFKYIYQSNSGPSVARNSGIRVASGDYIAFLDVDDVWYLEKLAVQVDLMEANHDVGMIFCDADTFDDNGKIRPSLRPSNEIEACIDGDGLRCKMVRMGLDDGAWIKGNFYKDFILGNLVTNSTVIVRKDVFQKVGFFDDLLWINQDYDLWLRVVARYKIIYLNRVFAGWRIRNDSLSGTVESRAFKYRKYDAIMFEKHLSFCIPEYKGLMFKRIIECYKKAIWGYFILGDLRESRKLCLKALAYNIFDFKIYFYIFMSFFPVRLVNRFYKR